MPTTSPALKALVARTDVMDAWLAAIRAGEMPDYGLQFAEGATLAQPAGHVVYVFPAAAIDGVLRDLDIMTTRLA